MKNAAYFTHEKIFNKRKSNFEHYSQDRIYFQLLVRREKFFKLNKKERKKAISYILKNWSKDFSMLMFVSEKYSIPHKLLYL